MHNSYVNAEYRYDKYLNEVLRKSLWVILEQMLWLGVKGGHKKGLWILAHKDNRAQVFLFSGQKDLGLRFSISKNEGYRDLRRA